MAKLHDEMNEEEKKMNGIAPEEDSAEGTSDKEETAETIHPDEAEDAGPDDTKEPADQPDESEEKGSGGEEKETSESGEDEEDVLDGQWISAEDEGKIRGLFKKKEKKDKKDQQIEELTDRVRRQMAEFDNFRKRTEKEKAASFEVGAKSVIEKILPVVDNFERGFAGADETDPFVEGMNKIYKQLMTTLEAMDVKPIEAVGKPFDPELHNAVMHVDDDSLGENVVAEELQKGYTYRGSVIRYSMVKVAN